MWKKFLLEDSHRASCECDCSPHYVDGSNQWPLTTLNAPMAKFQWKCRTLSTSHIYGTRSGCADLRIWMYGWLSGCVDDLVNCPTRQSLLLSIGSLHWLSSWRWWPSIGGGKIVSATLEARNGRFYPFFLQISQITYLQMENFVFAILYLVYFALKYMYFEDLSRISENGGYL